MPELTTKRNLQRGTKPRTKSIGLLCRAIGSLFLILLIPGATFAQSRYIAFGDSVTEAVGFDSCACQCAEDCGYPRRLENRFRIAGANTTVENYGKGGERTPEAMLRIDDVLVEAGAGANDALLLMEGTNDITRGISPETTIFNLGEIAQKAQLRGTETVYATLIPRFPQATVDPENIENENLARDIRDLAFADGRGLIDPFEVWSQIPDLFSTLYTDPDDLPFFDPVGHPNPQGFELLADLFFNALTNRDRVPPVIGEVEPETGAMDLAPLTPIRVRLYDFGVGLDLNSVSLRVNGALVAADTTNGGDQWLDVFYNPTDPLPNPVEVRVTAADRSFPTNVMDRVATTFTVIEVEEDECVPGPAVLCLDHEPGDRRFRVTMDWATVQGGGLSGEAFATPLAPLNLPAGGLLSFFDGNPEVLIKIVDGCGFNDRFWVFGAPTTNLGFELTVVDTKAKSLGAPQDAYEFKMSNDDGNSATTFLDSDAFATCQF